jgi:hypothetical protein
MYLVESSAEKAASSIRISFTAALERLGERHVVHGHHVQRTRRPAGLGDRGGVGRVLHLGAVDDRLTGVEQHHDQHHERDDPEDEQGDDLPAFVSVEALENPPHSNVTSAVIGV